MPKGARMLHACGHAAMRRRRTAPMRPPPRAPEVAAVQRAAAASQARPVHEAQQAVQVIHTRLIQRAGRRRHTPSQGRGARGGALCRTRGPERGAQH